ncbi:MAG TPA: efflux RND transporter periplasmic adaptor subunit, partial [Terracidiphilus sp.]|nr:efflux RND transporter periplasmic adaptor subunit [Terracidiphilus sp.]
MADFVELDRLVTLMHAPRYRSNLLLLALSASAALLLSGCDSNPSASAAAASAPPVSTAAPAASAVSAAAPVANAGAADERSFTTSGPLVADQQADIGPERDGRVVEIAVQVGDRVKAGQLLARLDDHMQRAACDARRARIASAQAEVRNWKAEQESARADLHRADAMLAYKILSQENWEVAKYKVDETTAQVDRYQSEQAAAEADLASATMQLEQSRILAPFAGVVGRSSVRPEQQLQAGTPVFWITAESPLHVL